MRCHLYNLTLLSLTYSSIIPRLTPSACSVPLWSVLPNNVSLILSLPLSLYLYISLFLSLSVYLSLSLSIYLSIYLLYMHTLPFYLSVCRYISIYLSQQINATHLLRIREISNRNSFLECD